MTVKAEIKNDTLHGRYWSFFDSGDFRTMGTYHNGRKNNLWIQFYPEGQQSNYGKWNNGNQVGLWILHGPSKIFDKNMDLISHSMKLFKNVHKR